MSTYLSNEQIHRIRHELSLLYSLPYAVDLIGTAWEQILADAKGGKWTQMRDNRPRPDITVVENHVTINYSVKTEGLKLSGGRTKATDFLGYVEDLIVARPKVDELLTGNQTITDLSAGELGALVLRYYNEMIVDQYRWNVLSILLRIGNREFIYWEERPVPKYNPADYWWQESGRATGTNRNINGYPLSVDRHAALPRAKFKWTSGGKQFYVLYKIPADSDIIKIDRYDLTIDDVKTALNAKLAEKLRAGGCDPPT